MGIGWWLFLPFLAALRLSESLRICTRRHSHLVDSAFFQRVELPSPEACVERCVEHIVYCKAAVFVSRSDKAHGMCELHATNTNVRRDVLQPDPSSDPLSTVYEVLDNCPPLVRADMVERLPEAMKNKLRKDKDKLMNDERKADAFVTESSRIAGEDTLQITKNEGYALMRSLEDDPKNPFEPDVSPSPSPPLPATSPPPSSTQSAYALAQYRKTGPPIRPVEVLHQGRCSGLGCPPPPPLLLPSRPSPPPLPSPSPRLLPQYPRVPPQFSQDHYDRSPCPAKSGDPCAPRPICVPSCPLIDSPPRREPSNAYPQPASRWSEWTTCSVSCGEGVRTRQCTTGDNCVGDSSISCFAGECPEWGEWLPWSLCSVTCGDGERSRGRICTLGRTCDGPSVEMDRCYGGPCPTWGQWGPWERCSTTCGLGRERRYRRCENGLACIGQSSEDRTCTGPPCPYLGGWTEWTACTASCGVGEKTRTRECIGGRCDGNLEERLLCNQQRCPEWTPWTAWSACDSCVEGSTRIRSRSCLPYPGCPGPAQDQSPCPAADCPTWSEWVDWTECSTPCGQGTQKRRRECRITSSRSPSPSSPSLAGHYPLASPSRSCRGPSEELRFCQIAVCPYWQEWTEWGGCSTTCGLGVCSRNRKCVTDELLDIPNLEEIEAAVADENRDGPTTTRTVDYPGAKADLIARSKSINEKKRELKSIYPEIRRHEANGLLEQAGTCVGPAVENKPCDPGPCCGWQDWSEWAPCDGCRPGALSTRRRQCLVTSAMFVEHHNSPPVPVSLQSDPARPGTYIKTPTLIPDNQNGRGNYPITLPPFDVHGMTPIIPINDPRHQRGKRKVGIYSDRSECICDGPSEDSRPCPIACPQTDRREECVWGEWSDWCGCSPCQGGKEVRRRYCDRPGGFVLGPPQPPRGEGGYAVGPLNRPDPSCRCPGPDYEERECAACTPVGSQVTAVGGGEDTLIPLETSVHVRMPKEFTTEYRKDTPVPRTTRSTTTPMPEECRWSRWSEWGECPRSRLKERRRYCIGGNDDAHFSLSRRPSSSFTIFLIFVVFIVVWWLSS